MEQLRSAPTILQMKSRVTHVMLVSLGSAQTYHCRSGTVRPAHILALLPKGTFLWHSRAGIMDLFWLAKGLDFSVRPRYRKN